MKRKLIAIALGLILTGCSAQNPLPTNEVTTKQTVKSDFNFVYRYGVTSKNELNTTTKTYTKDLITSGTHTIPFTLSASEIANIKTKISDLKLFNQQPVNTNSNYAISMSPCTKYYLKTMIDDTNQELTWDDCDGTLTADQQTFVDYIENILEQHPEYQNLPTATGGYL